MTDYDRGAYTPQTDAPLAFDPRRPSERRPMPMALIGSGVVLAVLLAGVAMVYRGGVRHAGESPRPVGEPVMAVKTAPPPSAQTAANAPSAASDVYNAGEESTPSPAANTVAAAPAPTFAPSAEQPAARPAPSAATVAMLSKPSAPTHIERRPTPTEQAAAPAAPAKLAAAPAKKTITAVETKSTASEAVASKTASGKTAVTKTATRAVTSATETKTASLTTPAHPTLRAKVDESELAAAGGTGVAPADADADTAPAAKPAAHKAKAAKLATADPVGALITSSTAAAAAPTGKSVVQIGAFSSSALADKGYADVSATLPGKMGGHAKHVQPLDKDGTTLYRTWLSGFASRADALAFCEALKAKGKTCLVKG